jgi:hypothetical protein
MIPVDHHPSDIFGSRYSPYRKSAYPRQVITFHLPFSGEAELFKCRPSSCIMWSIDISVSGGEIRFDLINWRDDIEELKREQNGIIERIRKQSESVTGEVAHFNTHLEEQARQIVSGRKQQLLKQTSLVESLGIPLRKASGVPQTFAVPVVPKKLTVKPAASDVAYAPQPTLDDATYQNILSIIHDMGVAMERHPSTYASK